MNAELPSTIVTICAKNALDLFVYIRLLSYIPLPKLQKLRLL